MATKPVIIDATCPGCKKDHAVAVPIDDLNIAMGRVYHDKEAPDIDAIIEKKLKEREAKEPPKPAMDEKPKKKDDEFPDVPSYIPRFKCADGHCDTERHKNRRYKKLPKSRCKNCDQFNPYTKGKCLWCDNDDLEEIEKEELEDLGIPMPGFGEEHEHGGE